MLGKIVFGAAAVATGFFIAALQSSNALDKLREKDQEEMDEKLAIARNAGFEDGKKAAVVVHQEMTNKQQEAFDRKLEQARVSGYNDGHQAGLNEIETNLQDLATEHQQELKDAEAKHQQALKSIAKTQQKELDKVRREAYQKGWEDALKDKDSVKAAYENLIVPKPN